MPRMSAQGWPGHQLGGAVPQAERGLAETFKTTLYGVASEGITPERFAVQAS
jgi:hypothetical protein